MCLLMTAMLVAAAGGHIVAQPHSNGLLFAGVDMVGLMKRVGVTAQRLRFDSRSVTYSIGEREEGLASEALIGVFQTIDQARNAFNELAVTPDLGRKLEGDTIGDECLYWSASGYRLKRLMFRRENLVLSFRFVGPDAAMIAQGKEIDGILLSDPGIAPRNKAVALPEMSITVAPQATTGEPIEISFEVRQEDQVQFAGTAECRAAGQGAAFLVRIHVMEEKPGTSGFGQIRLSERGMYDLDIPFATERNVIFQKTVQLSVSAPGDDPKAATPWDVPGDTLYFARQQIVNWHRLKAGEREWLEWHRGNMGLLKEYRQAHQKAFDELGQIVRQAWVPRPALLKAWSFHTPDGARTVYYAPLTIESRHVVYMGMLGSSLLIYVEQPATGAGLSLAEVIQEEVLPGKSQQGEYRLMASRTMMRYRATTPEGPFEPVQILLVEVAPVSSLNLLSPGYQ